MGGSIRIYHRSALHVGLPGIRKCVCLNWLFPDQDAVEIFHLAQMEEQKQFEVKIEVQIKFNDLSSLNRARET